MKELLFEPAADAAMGALESDPGRQRLLDRVDAALGALAADAGDPRCRRRAYGDLARGMWGMPVRAGDDDWRIMWLPGPSENQITVAYVGPDI